MYSVEVMQPYYSPLGEVGSDWDEVFGAPQRETEQAELQLARKIAAETRKFYTQVRIVKWAPGGDRGEVVV